MSAYHSVSDTCDNTTDDELSSGLVALEGSNLDKDTNNHNNTTPHHLDEVLACDFMDIVDCRITNHLATTKGITKSQSSESASQTSDLINSSDETLVDRVSLGFWEVVHERVGRNDTGHDSLIVSEKQETSGCNDRDSHSKLASVQANKLVLCAVEGRVVVLWKSVVDWWAILLKSIGRQATVILVLWVVVAMLLVHGVLVSQDSVVDVVSRHFECAGV